MHGYDRLVVLFWGGDNCSARHDHYAACALLNATLPAPFSLSFSRRLFFRVVVLGYSRIRPRSWLGRMLGCNKC